MIVISDIEDLNKLLRTEIIKQSQLDGKNVLNSLSVKGEDLDQLLQQSIYVSHEKNESFILFELRSRSTGTDVSFSEDDETITDYQSYELYVIIYGDSGSTLANKITSRFRTEKVRNSLLSKGIYIESVSRPEKINEYINETMWIRNDFSINVSCKMSISQIDTDSDFELGSLNINK